MKILIIFSRTLNAKDINSLYLFPLGLGYISSVLKKTGYDVDCLNLNHHKGFVKDIIHQTLETAEYDFVCTGGLSPYYTQVKEIVDAVRKHKSKPSIILGGGLMSSEPELMFGALNPDFMVLGEGEKTIVELLSCLKNKGNCADVLGIGYRDKSGQVICNKPQPAIMDLDSLPWPDFDGFEFETYLDRLKPTSQYFYDLYDHPRVYPIICSRSCPYKCTFCFHPLGNKYRQRSLNSIMEELEFAINRYRINVIAIYDELFSYNMERVYEFCERLKKLQAITPWEIKWTCQMRVAGLDEDFLRTMKNAGCYMVSYGFESYSSAVLNSMKKHVTPKEIDNAVQVSLKNNVSIQGNFIFGDKCETLQTATETLEYWKRNHHAGIILGFISPYPGTDLYSHCVNKGIIKDKLDFIANHTSDIINMTDGMSNNDFEQLKSAIFEAELKYSIRTMPLSIKKMKDNTFVIQVQCPHCHQVVVYKNYEIFSLKRYYFNIMVYCRECRRRYFIVSWLYNLRTLLLIFLYPLMNQKMRKAFSRVKDELIKRKFKLKRLLLRASN